MEYYPELMFNVDNGYLEGLVRGFKSGILSRTDYLNLIQCETLEGIGLHRKKYCIFVLSLKLQEKPLLLDHCKGEGVRKQVLEPSSGWKTCMNGLLSLCVVAREINLKVGAVSSL